MNEESEKPIDFMVSDEPEALVFVDEEGLLPGTQESTTTYGYLSAKNADPDELSFKFAPLTMQENLINQNLTSHGEPLYYKISEDGTILEATQGPNGNLVFTATLLENGQYQFTIHDYLDKAPPENLIIDPKFIGAIEHSDSTLTPTSAWHTKNIGNIWLNEIDPTLDHPKLVTYQSIHTEPYQTYNLNLQLQPTMDTPNTLEIYWDGKLLHELSGYKLVGGYTFSVVGGPKDTSLLELVTNNPTEKIGPLIQNIELLSAGQSKLPIEFYYIREDAMGTQDMGLFTVNITNEPPIILTNNDPYNIVFDQAVYHTIIINEQAAQLNTPYATINLDELFNHMQVPATDRHVSVEQRHEGDLATNVYEIKVADASDLNNFITVADVQLKFPGGDGGLDVFKHNVLIQDI